MIVKNVFKVNDWKISEFLIIVCTLQFGLLGLELLSTVGYEVPLLRPVAGFLCLTFLPGALLLRILGIHKQSSLVTVLYMAGLSLVFDMLAGFLMNTLYPIIGISQPITEYYIILTLFISVILLSVLCYFRDRDYHDDGAVLDIDGKTLAPALLLVLLPLVSIAGSYAVNVYNTPVLIYVLILAIALVVLLCGSGRFIPGRLYPLAIFSIAASLMFHNAFITNYLSYWDIHLEYNIASLVITGGFWDSSVASYLNSMLSIVFLVPFYYFTCSMDLTWVFKIIYPLIFCLVPAGLYAVYSRQADSKIACLACMFFTFLVTFFTEMQGLARQETAELFLVLIVLLMTDAGGDRHVKSLMMAVFGIALVWSHYGVSYIYLGVFVVSLVLLLLLTNSRKLYDKLRNRLPQGTDSLAPADHSLTLTFVGLFVCVLFFWYTFTSSSTALSSITFIVHKISTNMLTEFLDPDHVQGMSMLVQAASSPLYEIKKFMHLAFQGFIVVGFLLVVAQSVIVPAARKTYHFTVEYVIFSLVNLMICLSAIALPYFASSINTSRLYQITLVILAPMCIIGGLELIRAIASPLKRLNINVTREHAICVMAAILVVYMLFQTGFVFNIANDHPMSPSLSKSQINSYSTFDRAGLYDALNTYEKDYYAATWLRDNRIDGKPVYSDYLSHFALTSYGGTPIIDEKYIDRNLTNPSRGSYVYLGSVNINGNVGKEVPGTAGIFNVSDVISALDGRNRIYDSDGGSVYYVR